MEEESSTSIAKKQNMAARAEANLDENIKHDADIEPEEEEEEEETTLEEIKCLLVGVQQTLHDMRTENRKMAAEIAELKSSFNKHSTEISTLKKALKTHSMTTTS